MKEVEGEPDYVKGVDLLAPDGFGEIIGGSERETDINILVRCELTRVIKYHPNKEFIIGLIQDVY